MIARARRVFGQLRRDTSGVSAIEFAFALPVLALLYVGVVVIADETYCERQVSITARAVTDLVTHNATLTSAQLAAIMADATQIIAPYDASKSTVRVSEFQVTDTSTATVVWSKSQSGTALTAGSSVTIPTSVAPVGAYLIYGEVTYAYRPAVSFGQDNIVTLNDHFLMSPRTAGAISLTP